jgi:hypothetical protein
LLEANNVGFVSRLVEYEARHHGETHHDGNGGVIEIQSGIGQPFVERNYGGSQV